MSFMPVKSRFTSRVTCTQSSAYNLKTKQKGGANPLPRRAKPLLLLFRSNPPLRGGGGGGA